MYRNRPQALARECSVSEHAFLHVICRHNMKTACRPSDRDVNWRSPLQGKSTICRLKNHPVIQMGYLEAFILQPVVYSVHRLCPHRKFRRNGRKKEERNKQTNKESKKERKAVFYAIANKNMLFLIFRNMIRILPKYCFC